MRWALSQWMIDKICASADRHTEQEKKRSQYEDLFGMGSSKLPMMLGIMRTKRKLPFLRIGGIRRENLHIKF